MKCNFLFNSRLCSKLLEKLINSLAYDVLEKHENQNHCRINDFRSYRVHHLNNRKIQPKQSMKKNINKDHYQIKF